jgi:hypothetical protein
MFGEEKRSATRRARGVFKQCTSLLVCASPHLARLFQDYLVFTAFHFPYSLSTPATMSDITDKPSDETINLNRMKTAESVFLPISRETFEKLYLTPKHPSVQTDLRKKFGNPTPICLMGFLIASTPHACMLMGWRGAGGNGSALVPTYIFFGGIVQILGGIGEWIIGNTFSCAIFFTYGAASQLI